MSDMLPKLDNKVFYADIIEDIKQIKEALARLEAESKTLIITKTGVDSLPITISNTSVTSEYIVVESTLSNPSAQTSDWTINTYDGYVEISGSISGSTNVTLYLTRGTE